MKKWIPIKLITLLLILLQHAMYGQNEVQNTNDTITHISSISNNNIIGWGLIILLFIQLIIIKYLSDVIRSISCSDNINKNNNKISGIIIILFTLSFQMFGQSEKNNNQYIEADFSNFEIYTLLTLNIILSIVVLWMYRQFRQVLKLKGILNEINESKSLINFENILTRSVPLEKESAILFEHEYDGVKELDNVLPPWWLWMFYATIGFSFIYLIHYHITPIHALEKIGFVGPGVDQEKLYKIEMAEAEKQKQAFLAQAALKVNEENVTQLKDEIELSKGKEIFNTNCIVCHGKQAQGGAGPNLTDDYWLHGCDIKSIFKTIKYGVPAKGMIAWESQLSPLQIQEVASFVMSLRNTNPENPKEPQGEKCIQ